MTIAQHLDEPAVPVAVPISVGEEAPRLEFTLRHKNIVHRIVLEGGHVASIGRSPECAVRLDDASISGKHVELLVSREDKSESMRLLAKDCSRNGTGVLAPGKALSRIAEASALSSSTPEELQHGCHLIVPLRRKLGQDDGLGHVFSWSNCLMTWQRLHHCRHQDA